MPAEWYTAVVTNHDRAFQESLFFGGFRASMASGMGILPSPQPKRDVRKTKFSEPQPSGPPSGGRGATSSWSTAERVRSASCSGAALASEGSTGSCATTPREQSNSIWSMRRSRHLTAVHLRRLLLRLYNRLGCPCRTLQPSAMLLHGVSLPVSASLFPANKPVASGQTRARQNDVRAIIIRGLHLEA